MLSPSGTLVSVHQINIVIILAVACMDVYITRISPRISETLYDKFPKIMVFLKAVYRVGRQLIS